MLETLDAAAVRRWCAGGLELLRRHQREIDQLNVYPVPDGDTGTNLVLTMTSAQQALSAGLPAVDGDPCPHGQALRLMARGALLGARGNSGVIVAQILRGLADTLGGTPYVRGRALADALRGAAAAAYAAVAAPVEGTVLTVAAAAARGARQADSDDLPTVVRAAAAAGAEALAHTPEQLPVLANAGVVDAGGRGLCVLLEALLAVVAGEPAPICTPPPAAFPAVAGQAVDFSYAYEVQFLLDADEPAVQALRAKLAALGDSLAIVGTGLTEGERSTWNVHVHVDDIGAAIEAAVETGRPYQISVTRFADQMVPPPAGPRESHAAHSAGPPVTHPAHSAGSPVTHPAHSAGSPVTHPAHPAGSPVTHPAHSAGSPVTHPAQPADPRETHPAQPAGPDRGAAIDHRPTAATPTPAAAPGGPEPNPDRRAAVAVAAGDDLAALVAAEGAAVVSARPSVGEMLEAICSTGAGWVVVLPNDPDTQAVARTAAQEAAAYGVRVSVVPTRSPVQALAALAVRDPTRAFDDDVIAMAEAAGACRYAEVCYASREAITVAGPCRPGDVLALVEDEVHLIGADLLETCQTLLDRLLGGGGELVTLLVGAEAPAELADDLAAHIAQRWPFVEINAYQGGQPHCPLVVGVE